MMTKVQLQEHEMPTAWYNLAADLPHPVPPPLGGDGKPIGPDQLAAVFPMNLIEQEMSSERWIDIPQEVLAILYRWRPSPLHRAYGLEKALKTPARIYYKNEGVSAAGSHKPNTAVPQAYYNKVAGIEKLTTETGAGQWGSALSFACSQFGLGCKIYMVKSSYDHKPYRKHLMQTWGGVCVASPSTQTKAGRDILAAHPDSPGSLGIAISEAVEEAVSDPSGKTKYALGSVLNHVMLHQTIIGLETKKQLAIFGEKKVDQIIACAGGGSNFAGLSFPFLADKMAGADIEIIPVEPTSCPSLTKGKYCYDLGDVAGMTPYLPMYTLGHSFMPHAMHAGGLRYHGMSPLVSQALREGLLNPSSVPQLECFKAAVLFARSEGLVVAPETSHAVAQVIREAEKAREEGKEKVIIFGLSGHGMLDLQGYADYFAGLLQDYEYPEEEVKAAIAALPGFSTIAAIH